MVYSPLMGNYKAPSDAPTMQNTQMLQQNHSMQDLGTFNNVLGAIGGTPQSSGGGQTTQPVGSAQVVGGAQPLPLPTAMPQPAPYSTSAAATAMNPGPGKYSPYGNNPQPVPPPPGGGAGGAGGGSASSTWEPWSPEASNQYGGQTIAGHQPSQADYNSVQQYSDAAHENARRYLDPQQEMQNQRFDQELINKGIDPNSDAGQKAAQQLSMQQADADNAAAFNAMQFGQGIQNQMFDQSQQQAGLAGDMQKALWDAQLGGRGQEAQYDVGMAGVEANKYGAKLAHQLGMGQLDVSRDTNQWNKTQDLWQNNFQTKSYNDSMDMMRLALLKGNMAPAPNAPSLDPNSPYANETGQSGGTNVKVSG